MMKLLTLMFIGFVVAGLVFHKFAVVLFAVGMIFFMIYAQKEFKKQDAEWEREHPPLQKPTEEIIKEHPCSFM